MRVGLQPSTFRRLPPKERLVEIIRFYEARNADLTSFMWYIMPVAQRFGDRVYDVAARSLAESGLEVTALELKQLADELETPEGRARYAENRRLHIDSMITDYKEPEEDS